MIENKQDVQTLSEFLLCDPQTVRVVQQLDLTGNYNVKNGHKYITITFRRMIPYAEDKLLVEKISGDVYTTSGKKPIFNIFHTLPSQLKLERSGRWTI